MLEDPNTNLAANESCVAASPDGLLSTGSCASVHQAVYASSRIGMALVFQSLGAYIDVAGSRERTLGRVWQRCENGPRPNDVEIGQVESATDLEDHVLQLAPVRGRSGRPNAFKDPSSFLRRDKDRERGILAQRGRIISRGGVIPRRPATTLDRDSSLGTQAIQQAPKGRLADTRAHQACGFRRSEARRLHRKESKYLLARCRPHDASLT